MRRHLKRAARVAMFLIVTACALVGAVTIAVLAGAQP